MLKRSVYLLCLLVLSLFLSCSDDPVKANGDKTDDTITDIDGNVYTIVQIGDQWWMAEDLRVTHYRNGDAIPDITGDSEWVDLSTGASCAYNNESGNIATYGLLYNWYAVTDSRNIAPEGWHVPTDDEWKELEIALGMSPTEVDASGTRGTDEGAKLAGNEVLWENGYIKDNAEFGSSGFDALPGGCRESTPQFGFLGYRGYWWTVTDINVAASWFRSLDCYETNINRGQYNKRYGLSVRCVKD